VGTEASRVGILPGLDEALVVEAIDDHNSEENFLMAKDKKTQRSDKTLPNQWSPMNKQFKNRERKKHAAEIRAMKHQNLSRNR
jgi:hypothetical protein